MAVIIYGWGGVWELLNVLKFCLPDSYVINFCLPWLLCYVICTPKYEKAAWRVTHFVTYFLQHVLSVGNCLLYARFYLKDNSNKILKISFSNYQIFKWFIIILKSHILSPDCFVRIGWTGSICQSGMCLFIHQAAYRDISGCILWLQAMGNGIYDLDGHIFTMYVKL